MPLYNQTGMVWQTIGGTTLAAADIRILYYVITHTILLLYYYYYIGRHKSALNCTPIMF